MHATRGGDKGVCSRGWSVGGVGGATNPGFDSQPKMHMYTTNVYMYVDMYMYLHIGENVYRVPKT